MRSEILSAVHDVAKILCGLDYKEVSYQRLMLCFLQKEGVICSSEVNISYDVQVGEEKVNVGWGRMDIVCTKNNVTYILELKTVPTHKYLESYRQQIDRYMFHYDGPCHGALIIFDGAGGNHVEFR